MFGILLSFPSVFEQCPSKKLKKVEGMNMGRPNSEPSRENELDFMFCLTLIYAKLSNFFIPI